MDDSSLFRYKPVLQYSTVQYSSDTKRFHRNGTYPVLPLFLSSVLSLFSFPSSNLIFFLYILINNKYKPVLQYTQYSSDNKRFQGKGTQGGDGQLNNSGIGREKGEEEILKRDGNGRGKETSCQANNGYWLGLVRSIPGQNQRSVPLSVVLFGKLRPTTFPCQTGI